MSNTFNIKKLLKSFSPLDIEGLSDFENEALSIDLLGYCAAYALTGQEIVNLKKIIERLPLEIAEDFLNDILLDSEGIFNGLRNHPDMLPFLIFKSKLRPCSINKMIH